jgi:hypothetical protein
MSQKPEDYGLPPYPEGIVIGPCVCGSWPGGPCLRCPVIPNEWLDCLDEYLHEIRAAAAPEGS